jgi:sugar phosphate isomerase/epimerase
MLNIGARAHDYCTTGISETAEAISSLNFSRIQLALTKSIKGFGQDAGLISPGFATNVRNTLAARRISIAVLGCYINIAHPDERTYSRLSDFFKAHLRYSRDFGASLVGTETGSLNSDYSFTPENHTSKALDFVIKRVSDLVSCAEKSGAIVGIEAVTKHIISSPERMKIVLDSVNSSNLQVIFDPVNLLDENNYTQQEKIIETSFELFGDRIIIIHSKDFIISSGEIKTVETGKGLLNYRFLLNLIEQKKPLIDILLENSKPETAAQCREYLQQCI